MARQKGTANFSGTLEPLASGPIDARTVVPTLADLTVASNFPYAYVGLETYVTAENKKYRLIGADVTQSANWEEVGSGGGGDSTKILTGTLAAASWSSKTQTVNVTGITANTKGVVGLLQSATTAQVEAAKGAGIVATAIGNGTITFACDEVPSVDIPFGVLIPGGQTPQVTANATVDSNTGTPDVQVTVGGTDDAPIFNFAFSNLKGATGAQGPKGDKGDTGATGPQGPSGAVLKNYSTSEQDSGLTWVDGKKLYQKTINCGTLPNNSTKDVSLGVTVGTLVGLYGFCYSATGTTFPVPCSLNSDDNITVWLLSGKQSLRIKTQTDRSAYTCWVTLLYTK